jgi:16S rRNA processing protein RimM
VLVPFVVEIVPVVDVVGRRLVIDPPGGMFDADEA